MSWSDFMWACEYNVAYTEVKEDNNTDSCNPFVPLEWQRSKINLNWVIYDPIGDSYNYFIFKMKNKYSLSPTHVNSTLMIMENILYNLSDIEHNSYYICILQVWTS